MACQRLLKIHKVPTSLSL